MLCKKPFFIGIVPHGCSQCLPCRINRRRLWTSRIMLESLQHLDSSFVTLTYDQKNHPKDGGLDPRHTTLWLKKLRLKLSPRKIRYFLVGEYGDQTHRPHYHAALFGVSPLESSLISDSWGLGFTYSGDLNKDSAQYIAGYVTKKMTSKDDVRLQGRYPEFARMSRKPGLGALAVPQIADALTSTFGVNAVANQNDVPLALKDGSQKMPLGRYLRAKLRRYIGDEEIIKKENKIRHAEEMSLLLKVEGPGPDDPHETARQTVKRITAQKILNLETKTRIYSRKGLL